MCNEWKHPSYYKELAKVRKEFEEEENSKTNKEEEKGEEDE
ncbi:hypothetical protein [uncultured Mediterranean phage uvMED]|jgi:hypothetical protein|nr:hypothetical protein [uncultured Mediterranean phage uvMED]|tara:strand:+ start:520 stop:642 length:123 start_codon:yes stop_codon:yes gene_type:complete